MATLCSLLIFFVAIFLSHMHCFVCYSHASDQNGHQNGHQNGGERVTQDIYSELMADNAAAATTASNNKQQ